MSSSRINLLGLDSKAMEAFFVSMGEPRYRAQQLIQWIHQFGEVDYEKMTNVGKSLKQKLKEHAEIILPSMIKEQCSQDGTRKWLIQLGCGSAIETVFIPEDDRGTLCVSSQVGCAINCSFCATGKQGFSRNLSTAEIIGQLWFAARRLSEKEGQHDHQITNVVMMGMGEPLLNIEPVISAMDLMMDDHAYGLSKRRVTLSTSGLIPQMEMLKARSPVSLAVSLHASRDDLRNILVPINKKYPIAELMAVCKTYFENEPRRVVTFEYVMLHEVNDSIDDARQLVRILKNVPAKVNLIPFNPIPGADYVCSSPSRLQAFRQILLDAGINVITRKTRGDDIDAACGQLAGVVKDRTRRVERMQKQQEEARA